jgi:chemotaxis protein MotB
MKAALKLMIIALAAVVAAPACMMTGTHEEILKKNQDQNSAALAEQKKKLADQRDVQKTAKEKLQGEFNTLNTKSSEQEAMLASMSMKIDKLSGEKGKLAAKQTEMTEKQRELLVQVNELKRMRAAAERRNADFRRLVEKLKKMMDAGTLEVKPRNGLLVVQMSSDVMFAPGATRLKDEAKVALAELATTLASFEGRRFQVVGHSDNIPIHSARFPSNWELSSSRAVVVVKLLVESGVKPEMISAAGNAEFDPLVGNDEPEDRAQNRRVEIVFLPKIDELPGFDEVLKGK